MTRLLLPFNNDIEMDVVELLVHLSSNQRATLVPLSLISLPQTPHKGVRLERMQQSKDFLEAVRYKAERRQISLEPVEVWTRDVEQSILLSVEQFHCDGILLAVRGARGSLLRMDTIAHLIERWPCSLFVVSLPPKKSNLWRARLRERFANVRWWSRCSETPEDRGQVTLAPFPWGEREAQEPVALSHAGFSFLEERPRV